MFQARDRIVTSSEKSKYSAGESSPQRVACAALYQTTWNQKWLLQSEQSIEAEHQQPRSVSPQGNEPKRQAWKIAAKRAHLLELELESLRVSAIDQGMSLLASKRGCIGWHRRLRCIYWYPVGQCWWSSLKTTHRFSSHHHDPSIKKTRNIGIIAHIDAVSSLNCVIASLSHSSQCQKGKTTTTERMLYYSGFTRRIGGMSRDGPISLPNPFSHWL